VLLPDCGVPAEKFVALAEKNVEEQPEVADYLEALGAALCRAGKFQEAIQRLEESIKNRDDNSLTLGAELFLALAYEKTVGHDKAVLKLHKARDQLTAKPANESRPADFVAELFWQGRIRGNALLAEATALIEPTQSPKTSH
jgi:tetratricopeptide (TPR) repeat protein